MADQHHRAFEFVERHRQGFAGRQVEMIGRFVEQQQIRALPDDHAQHETRLFAAAQGADRLLDHVAAEIEGAKKSAQILLATTLPGGQAFPGHAHHVFQRIIQGTQNVEFLLREVADAQALPFGNTTVGWNQHAGDGFHQRRLALPVGTENADSLAGHDRLVHVAHDHRRRRPGRRVFRRRIAETGILHGQHGIGQVGRFLEFKREVGTGQHRRQTLHAFQRLDPALRLLGFGGLGLEARDELLQVGDLVLLFDVGVLLQFELLRASILKGAVIAAVTGEFSVLDMQRHRGDGIKKFAVVADDDHGSLIALEPGFEPDQRVEIEVVGRFVEQQQIGRTHQRASQLQTHAPAAGEAIDRIVQLGGLEAETENQRLSPRLRVMCAGVVQRHVGMRHAFAVVAGFGRVHLALRGKQGSIAFNHEIGRRLRGFRHLLRHLRHTPLRRHAEVAGIFMQVAVDQGKQRRLAGTIAPDQADFFTGIERHRRVFQNHLGATAQSDVFESDHESE